MRFQCGEESGEEIAWIHSPVLFICQRLWRTILIHSPPHDITELVMCYATCPTSAAGFRFIRKDIALLANKLENGEESGGFL